MEKQYTIKTPAEFKSVIEDIFSEHKKTEQDNLVITLDGTLGAGKTAFTKVLGEQLNITETIVSPTFNIMKQYQIDSTEFDELIHIDAYRLEDVAEASPLRLQELISQPKKIVCIEWPEIIASIIPEQAVRIKINIKSDEEREVVVSYI